MIVSKEGKAGLQLSSDAVQSLKSAEARVEAYSRVEDLLDFMPNEVLDARSVAAAATAQVDLIVPQLTTAGVYKN